MTFNNRYNLSLPVLHLMLDKNILLEMYAKKQTFPAWPARPEELRLELQSRYTQIAVCVRQVRGGKYRGNKRLLFCTSAYYLEAAPSRDKDGYIIVAMRPLSFREHDILARGSIRLYVATWFIHIDMGSLNHSNPLHLSNEFSRICDLWQRMQQEQPQFKDVNAEALLLTPARENYLALVEKAIDITEKAEIEKEEKKPPILYNRVDPIGKSRHSSHDVYSFQRVPRSGKVEQGMLLSLEGDRSIRGRVIEVRDKQFTVRFVRAIDIKDLHNNTAFIHLPSNATFQVQRDTLEILRNGRAENPFLLSILVDNQVQPFKQVKVPPLPPNLNLNQQIAFKRAFAIQDMLLVWGPPGTGKTHTITEIACACGRIHQRILMTARTHRAVDNVLQNLPTQELEVLRIGQEDQVIANNRHLLIDERANALQHTILQSTEIYSQMLLDINNHLDEIDQHVSRIPANLQSMQSLEHDAQHAIFNQQRQRHSIEATFEQKKKQLERDAQENRLLLEQLYQSIDQKERRLAQAQKRQSWFLIGFFWERQIAPLQQQLSTKYEKRTRHEQLMDHLWHQYQQLPTQLQQSLQSEDFLRFESQVQAATHRIEDMLKTLAQEAHQLANTIITHIPLNQQPPLGTTSNPIQHYLDWFYQSWNTQFRPMLVNKHAIMRDWRQELESRKDELYPILLRMADVIGVTCVGSATAKMLAGLDFDLVLVDEAGQINLPDLLVPLVRGKRSILFGDHQQLPPLLEKETENRLRLSPKDINAAFDDDATSEQDFMVNLLKKSVFEDLILRVESSHFVTFQEQRRMPVEVADFASQQFYQKLLYTEEKKKKEATTFSDLLFNKPFVFIDAAHMDDYKDSPSGDAKELEEGQSRSYINKGEAEMIAEIVEVYTQENLKWTVIVPYKAQARYIRARLAERLINEHDLDLNALVATVDTFQGGECDRVIYGFTRSNSRHKIGFLSELRRLNVAITRAKKLLILIGDSRTLTQTPDASFRSLSSAMVQHATQYGEKLTFRDYRSRIAQLQKKEHRI